MEYDIGAAAEDLMLEPEELEEIFELYFEDASELMEKFYTAYPAKDYIDVAKVMHALKGASANLRIDHIAAICAIIENLAKAGKGEEISPYLPNLQDEINNMKEYINAFYSKLKK